MFRMQLYLEMRRSATQRHIEWTSIRSVDHHKTTMGNKIGKSEYQLLMTYAVLLGSRLLRNAKVQARVTQLLNDMLRDDVVDSQLAKLVLQDFERPA